MVLPRKNVESDIYDLSKAFAIRIINLYKFLCREKAEYVISKQLLRSGTSIGANVHEGKEAQSRSDFSSKMNIALKEARESEYWIDLLKESEYITEIEYNSLSADCSHVVAVLVKIVKATKDAH